MAEEKTYVFGEGAGNNGILSLLGSMLSQKGVDPNVLLAMQGRNNDGFGEGGWFIWVIFLFFLMGWGGNGFGNNGAGGLGNQLNNDYGREMLLQAINGNGNAISQLATTLVQNIYLEDWDWHVTVYYAVDTYYTDEILEELELIGCSWSELVKAENLLRSNQYNIGITYSNFKHKCSIVVIGLTTSAEEFQNTFDHEKGHLAMHISSALKIKPYGEEYQYLTGEIGQSMFKIAKRFLCDDCRQKLVIEIKEIDKKD